VKEKEVDQNQLQQKLEKILFVVEAEDFDIGKQSLNRYIKTSVRKLIDELGHQV
jgi:hypothetical protein